MQLLAVVSPTCRWSWSEFPGPVQQRRAGLDEQHLAMGMLTPCVAGPIWSANNHSGVSSRGVITSVYTHGQRLGLRRRAAVGSRAAAGPIRRHRWLWRSLVAHLTGGQVVAGSNPVSPTGK